MRVAVLTLTRDRLDYTKHCFGKLRELAGCWFDHYVLDQGSTDGTPEWLVQNAGRFRNLELLQENIGISKGMNRLLDVCRPERYDAVVKIDNDCELVMFGTLAAAVRAVQTDRLTQVSPRVEGLNDGLSPEEFVDVNGERVGTLGQIGGLFSAVPGRVYQRFRYDESNPVGQMDDVQLSEWVRRQGGTVGYLMGWRVNHFETTRGQWARYPEYFERKFAEAGETFQRVA